MPQSSKYAFKYIYAFWQYYKNKFVKYIKINAFTKL